MSSSKDTKRCAWKSFLEYSLKMKIELNDKDIIINKKSAVTSYCNKGALQPK